MPSEFDRLAGIIGIELTIKVITHMGGKFVRIRKRVDSIQKLYMNAPELYNSMTIRGGARALNCSISTMCNLRKQWRSRPF